MTKLEELTHPNSCLARASDDEMIFVLLSRDVCAPLAIRAWAEARVVCGKNRRGDLQIVEALAAAERMEDQRG
jgi:hypothetical protein